MSGLAVFEAPWVAVQYRPRWWQRRLLGWAPLTLRFKPVRMGELGALLRALGPAIQGDDEAVLDCLALSSGESPEVLRRLPRAVLAVCVRAFVGLHQDILAPADADPVSRETKSTWADLSAVLTAGGHSPADVRGYTLAQFRAHLGAASRSESRRQGLAIIASRMALAKGEDAQRVINGLLAPKETGSTS